MNKKIKIIKLLNKIANGEEVPMVIEYKGTKYKYDKEAKTYYEVNQNKGIYISFDTDELNDYVEILEDNTEEIEEIDEEWTYIEGQVEKTWSKSELELVEKFNKLAKAVNQIRKKM